MIPLILIQSTFSIRPGFDHQHYKDALLFIHKVYIFIYSLNVGVFYLHGCQCTMCKQCHVGQKSQIPLDLEL